MKKFLLIAATLAILCTGECGAKRKITNIESASAVWLTDCGKYVIHGDGFKKGDVIRLVSADKSRTYKCITEVLGKTVVATLPAGVVSGTYDAMLGRKVKLATTEFTINEAAAKRGPVKIVAHRGYHEFAPENSIEALRASQLYGFYGSEFDIWITADNTVMVQHDGKFTLDGRKYRLEETTLDVARKFSLENGEPLPTLDEYLQQGMKTPWIKMVLEIKTHKDFGRTKACIDSTLILVDKYGMADQMDYITFCWDACVYLRSIRPDAIVRYLDMNNTDYLAPEKVASAKLTGPYPMSGLLKKTEGDIAKCHDLGMEMAVWNVKPDELNHWIAAGVDVVNGNYPKVFIEKFRQASIAQ